MAKSGRAALVAGVALWAIAAGTAGAAETVNYGYDPLGRVISVTYSTGETITYAYDAAGNRIQQIVSNTNQAPTAVPDAVSTGRNAALTFDPRLNDTDPDGNALTIVGKTNGTSGTVVIAAGGTGVTYTPNAGFVGTDSFTYTISDGGLTSTATVTVTVANRSPAAVADSRSTNKNTPVSFDPRSNDSDPDGDALTITAKTNGTYGAVAITGGGTGVTYTPNAGFAGSDSFTYTISDGGLTSTATVTVTVNNQAPMAVADSRSTNKNTAVSFDPRTNDSDPNGDALTITARTNGTYGAVAITGGGTGVTYTPNAGFAGTDSFTYTISDGALTSTATVTVTVANRSPAAVADSRSTNKNAPLSFDPRSNDSDPDGDALTITARTNGTYGTVAITGGGTGVTYTPNAGFVGTDSFTYTISDGGLTATATVTVTVANQAPTPANDSLTTAKNVLGSVNPLANDSDPNGDSLTIVGKTNGSSGTVTIYNGTSLYYAPNPGFAGSDSFTYTVSDGALTATATVNVTVTNQGPVAVNDSKVTSTNTALSFDPRVNDTDGDNDSLTITGKTNGASGAVAITGGGTGVTYTPNTGFNGADSFTYTISDGALSSTATVNVTVSAPITVLNPTPFTTQNKQTTFPVSALGSIGDGSTLTITAATVAPYFGGGVVTIAADAKSLNYHSPYVPECEYAYPTVSYTLQSTNGQTANGVISFTVQGPYVPTCPW